MAVISMKQLLEAGVHFGHQTRRWNPKMAPYIFAERNGIYIIDLQKTVKKVNEAYDFVREVAAAGKPVLFVGTKKQAQETIKEEALRAGEFFVNERWLGGMLTNYQTIEKRIKRLNKLAEMEADGTLELLTKKEKFKLLNEREKLERFLGGIKDMPELPGALFVIDPRKEKIAVTEAKKLGILKEKDQRCKSWEDFHNKYQSKKGFFYDIDSMRIDIINNPVMTAEQLTENEAVAIKVFSRLLKLRRDWIGNWEPNGSVPKTKYCIVTTHTCFTVNCCHYNHHAFSFPTKEMAEEFLNCFMDLFEDCKILI